MSFSVNIPTLPTQRSYSAPSSPSRLSSSPTQIRDLACDALKSKTFELSNIDREISKLKINLAEKEAVRTNLKRS